MRRCCPTLRAVRNCRLRHCHTPRRNGAVRRWFVSVLLPVGCSQPLASGPFCFEIQPPARSRPPLRSRRRCGQLRPRARGQLTAASAVFRGLVLLPSSQHPLPQPPTDTASQHPLPHPPTDTASQHPPPHPPTDTTSQHPPPHPPTDTASQHPRPHPPTDTASQHPLPHPPTDT